LTEAVKQNGGALETNYRIGDYCQLFLPVIGGAKEKRARCHV